MFHNLVSLQMSVIAIYATLLLVALKFSQDLIYVGSFIIQIGNSVETTIFK